jgi:hypothetical protein
VNIYLSKYLIVIAAISFAITTLAQGHKPLYSVVIGNNGFASFDGKDYISLSIYLNNNTKDTLYYQGAEQDNALFTLDHNSYFHLADETKGRSTYLKAVLPPHRSKKMQILLTRTIIPNKNVSLKIQMKLYKWVEGKVRQDKGLLLLGNPSDSTVLHYNKQHQSYWSIEDFDKIQKKQERILPDKDLYLLTDNDRNFYTFKAETDKISLPRDIAIRKFKDKIPKRGKVVNVPVKLYNHTRDTLKFYTMSCSWNEIFGTDHQNIGMRAWPCDKNAPMIIKIAPRGEYRKILPIVYPSTFKKGEKYRIYISLLKVNRNDKWGWDFSPNEYNRFNKVWSNEIVIR